MMAASDGLSRGGDGLSDGEVGGEEAEALYAWAQDLSLDDMGDY